MLSAVGKVFLDFSKNFKEENFGLTSSKVSDTSISSLNNTSDPVNEAASDKARQYDRLGSAKNKND